MLFAYAQGIISSRGIEWAYRERIFFIALPDDSAPHFSTIADFVSRLSETIAPLFARILYLCEQQGLIGREMFAIDGVKLPGNEFFGRFNLSRDTYGRVASCVYPSNASGLNPSPSHLGSFREPS